MTQLSNLTSAMEISFFGKKFLSLERNFHQLLAPYSPQMDNEGKALGQALIRGLQRKMIFQTNYHMVSYRCLLYMYVSKSEGSVDSNNIKKLTANS